MSRGEGCVHFVGTTFKWGVALLDEASGLAQFRQISKDNLAGVVLFCFCQWQTGFAFAFCALRLAFGVWLRLLGLLQLGCLGDARFWRLSVLTFFIFVKELLLSDIYIQVFDTFSRLF